MNYPSINEYKEAILFAEDNFEQLKNLRPVLGDDGSPVMTSGNFAVVFKMKDEQTGKLHAVKCFRREQEGRAEAYRMIAEELEFVSSTFLTPIKYLDKELYVDTNAGDEKEFPVLLMDWVEGETLDKYIRKHLDDQYELSLLAYQFSRLAMWLMPQPFAHGDLKPDNILVKEDGTLVLVDYDGMYVPAMKGQKARELGSPDFRHPGRTEEVFDDHIDDFSLASILLSLKAIALQPSLLEEYGASDRLLFSEKDYRNLSESSALGALQPLMQDAELASLYSLYILALSQNNLSQVSFRLLYLQRPKDGPCQKPATTRQNKVKTYEDDCENDSLNAKDTEEDLFDEWTAVGESYDLREIWETIYPGLYDQIDSEIVDVSETENHEGSMTLAITIPLKDGSSKTLNLSSASDLRKGDKVILSTIVGQEFRKIGYNPIVRYDGERYLTTKVTDNERGIYDQYGVKYYRSRLLKSALFLDKATNSIESFIRNMADTHDLVKNFPLSYSGDSYSYAKNIMDSIDHHNKIKYNTKEYIIWEGTKVICDFAFKGCNGLTSIRLPESLTMIGIGAFEGCAGVKAIMIPYRVETIDSYVFDGCRSLNSIMVDERNVHYDSRDNCNAIIETSSNTLIFGSSSTIIPSSVTSIKSRAFDGRDGLTSIKIPSSIIEIKESILSNCPNLTSIIVDKNNSFYDSRNDCNSIISTQSSTLVSGCSNTIIPHSVKRIGAHAFHGCTNLTSIIIPNEVQEIGEHAFDGCKKLNSITIPESVKIIGYWSFFDCEKMNSVVFNYGLEKIGNSAFWDCKSLKSVIIPNSVKEIADSVFRYCDKLTSVVLPESIEKIGKDAFEDCESLTSIIVPNGKIKKYEKLIRPKDQYLLVEQGEIDSYTTRVKWGDLDNAWIDQYGAKYSKDKRRLLEVPYVLKDCSKKSTYSRKKKPDVSNEITHYTIRNGTMVICDKTFACSFFRNRSITAITIPDSVIKIGKNAFQGCKSLDKIYIPKGTLSKFKQLLPDYYYMLVEKDDSVDSTLSSNV